MTTPDREGLPIEVAPRFLNGAWSVRLPVRAEHITISKRSMVCERVVVRRRRAEGAERVSAVVRREELRGERSGQVEVTETRPADERRA